MNEKCMQEFPKFLNRTALSEDPRRRFHVGIRIDDNGNWTDNDGKVVDASKLLWMYPNPNGDGNVAEVSETGLNDISSDITRYSVCHYTKL